MATNISAPGWTRTSNIRLRRPVLYPVELRGQYHAADGVGETAERSPKDTTDARLRPNPVTCLGALELKPVKVAGMSPEDEDLTRKQRREQARAQRKEIEQAQAAKETARRRLQLMGSVVAVVVVPSS